MKLKDQVAIVTGAGRGIGRAIALEFVKEGAAVSLVQRGEEELRQVAKEVEALGGKCLVLPLSVAREDHVEQMVQKTVDAFGTVDIMVNNAGIAGPTAMAIDISPQQWNEVIAINLTGPWLCSRAVLKIMMPKRRGRIINISSAAAKIPLARRTPYCATKAGLCGMTRALAQELGPYNINVNSILPGATGGRRINEVIEARAKAEGVSFDTMYKQYVSMAPLQRMVEGEDIAKMALYLASEDGHNITGQSINVTAGACMS